MRVERISWDGADAPSQAATLRASQAVADDVLADTARIVADVRARGDAALRELTARLDALEVGPDDLELRVDPAAIADARQAAEPDVVGALEVAARNVHSVARAELEAHADTRAGLPQGQTVSIVGAPVSAAGIYAPGGLAPYPSSVLMCCIPARVAGVDRIAVASPPGHDGRVNPAVLTACSVAGVDEVYALGGAQAVAALAYGTESVAPVDAIAGPGNRYVNEAKRAVFGEVGIDGIAGPSELLAVIDTGVEPRLVALDLLAQAEHGTGGLLVAISPDGEAIAALAAEIEALTFGRPSVRADVITVVEAPDLGAAIDLADAIAPEHLELAFETADERLAADRVAGCVFWRSTGAAAFGDYAAGSNHVLPTGGAARFGGPLGIGAFRRRTSLVELPPAAAAGLAPRVEALARAEGFPVHGESATARGGD
jgi:histidinol dehydrogenase